MTGPERAVDPTRPAGDLGVWIGEITGALQSGQASEVPCGDCTACCSASQFVHVGPEEASALAVIPPELLFPAPGLPPGHQLIGYDRRGRCPLLGEAGCTIYAGRPRACRVYDCRVFTATGVLPDEPEKALVAAQVAAWRFAVTTPEEELRWDALHAAARFVASLPQAAGQGSTALALAALRVHHLFVRDGQLVEPAPADVVAVLSEPAAGTTGESATPK
jgi:hypothetical protein